MKNRRLQQVYIAQKFQFLEVLQLSATNLFNFFLTHSLSLSLSLSHTHTHTPTYSLPIFVSSTLTLLSLSLPFSLSRLHKTKANQTRPFRQFLNQCTASSCLETLRSEKHWSLWFKIGPFLASFFFFGFSIHLT